MVILLPLVPPSRAGAPAAAELTEGQALAALATYAESHRGDAVPAGCLRPRTVEYKNAGYTLDLVAEGCPGLAPGTVLGRWRVDARNGELFVRNPQGRYVRPEPSPTPAGPTVSVREERTVTVDGLDERWRLEWVGKTEPVCAPESGWDEWGTCPCAGFEFAEDGELVLVRARPGAPEERLPLAPLFQDATAPGNKAVLKRWPLAPGDADDSQRPGFAARVRARPPAPAMVLADYDRDGRATEFALQIGAIPCGHRQTIVVGIDARNPRLHAFAAVEEPGTPLVLESPEQWERLRTAAGETSIRLWACGDHGSEEEQSVRLRTDKDGIHAQVAATKCP